MSSAQDHVNAYLEIIQGFKHDSGFTTEKVATSTGENVR